MCLLRELTYLRTELSIGNNIFKLSMCFETWRMTCCHLLWDYFEFMTAEFRCSTNWNSAQQCISRSMPKCEIFSSIYLCITDRGIWRRLHYVFTEWFCRSLQKIITPFSIWPRSQTKGCRYHWEPKWGQKDPESRNNASNRGQTITLEKRSSKSWFWCSSKLFGSILDQIIRGSYITWFFVRYANPSLSRMSLTF